MQLTFGTDGIRGRAGVEITEAVAYAVGRATGEVFGPCSAVLGGDTRVSTPSLADAAAAGLRAAGCDLIQLGVAPTPMVAFVAAQVHGFGVVISASHNPFTDNGIKVIGPGGTKLDQDLEGRIALRMNELFDPDVGSAASPTVEDPADWAQAYIAHLQGALEGRDLAGMHLIIDTAHGAASAIASSVFVGLGARVQVINDRPDGRNINANCGATDTEALSAAVRAAGADLGLALDGDADRLIAVDEHGEVVDGDRIIALCALDQRDRGRLAGGAVAVTVMTNLGFHAAMAAAGIEVVQTPVGDRHVSEAIDARRLSLGGEQSGHVIFRDHASTGDGMLTGLMVADLCRRRAEPLSVLAARVMERFPQVLINVPVGVPAAQVVEALSSEIAAAESQLIAGGRVLVRASGTEPLVRVMVEAPTPEQAEATAHTLAGQVTQRFGVEYGSEYGSDHPSDLDR